ncbi:cytochrome c oxidase subunit II [Acaricomes phytoseiuli]|uniref:aa3-type cytochrome oxidase subunit II n=1 Tax=Acaricomes phytoseiuli TaxID=291968 RepID=UPI000379D9A4
MRVITATAVGIVSALVLSACTPEMRNGWLPTERNTTNHTGRIIDLWVNSWIAAIAVGIITWGLIIWCIIAYRRRKGATGFPRQISYNLPLEVFYLTIPLFMVLVFFYFTDRDQQAIDARVDNPDVTINVQGKQWAWDFNYLQGPVIPEDVYEATAQVPLDGQPVDPEKIPTLYLPVNKSVEFVLESRDVIHSFWVPAFLQKRDLIPGKTNYINVTPQQEGSYDGKCAELCGEYHSEMLFRVKVVSEAEFQQYLQSLKDAGNVGTLDEQFNRNPNLNDTSAQ